jgi:hypothetical protein
MHANQRDSPLLRLPQELRDLIYELTFLDSKITITHTRPSKYPVTTRPSHLCAGFRLLQVCAQIQQEAQAYFYANCVFDFGSIEFWGWGSPDVVRGIQLITISENTAKLMEERRVNSEKKLSKRHERDWTFDISFISAFRSLRRVYVDCRTSKTQQHTEMSPPPTTEKLRLCFAKEHLEVVFIRTTSI